MTADQSPLFPRTSTDRLRTILTARLPADPKWVAWIDGVVGELAGCVVEDPRLAQIVPKLERARDEWDAPLGASYARQIWDRAIAEVRAVLDAPPVDATPPQGIDRAALNRVLEEFSLLGLNEKSADRILALVRPVEGVWPEHPDQTVAVVDRLTGRELGGVVISRQDAADLAFVARVGEPHVLDTERAERVLALAARLEALS